MQNSQRNALLVKETVMGNAKLYGCTVVEVLQD